MNVPIRVLLLFLAVLMMPLVAEAVDCLQPLAARNPVAVDDVAYISAIGNGVVIPVLSNDIFSSSSSLSITTITTPAPAKGTVVRNADNTLTYTPTVLEDYSFTYTIVDTSLPAAPTTGTVVVHAPSNNVTIGSTCSDGICTFTAMPVVTDDIRSYSWTWGDQTPNQPIILTDKVNHQYGTSGTYHVTVTVSYYSGDMLTGSLDVAVSYSEHATWDPIVPHGLVVSIENIRGITTFPAGTQVAANWSRNPADCDTYCGPNDSNFDNWGTCPTSCRVAGGRYNHSGTYQITLRFIKPVGPPKDYPIIVSVTNNAPALDFTATRDTPNTRNYSFALSIDDDGPFPTSPAEWDFGDGTTYLEPGTPLTQLTSHLYTNVGSYVVGVQVHDADGKIGLTTKAVQVTNSAPIPKVRANCSLLDCTFGVEPSIDDGQVSTWNWNFGDGTMATGATVTKHFTTAGCYDVMLQAVDADGANGTAHQTIPVGPPVFAIAGGAVVDAHVQSYYGNSQWSTTTGNLNGILEPGESAVVEPQWHTTPSSQPVQVLSAGWTSTDWSWAYPQFRDFTQAYDVSTGTSDCWTAGRCYVISLAAPQSTQAHGHNDISFQETYLTSGTPTPGSPIVLHVGKSFPDVPISHWAYSAIESVLHAGMAGSCTSDPLTWSYCPGNTLTRAQVAKWLLIGEHGSGYTPPPCTGVGPFTDVPCSNPDAAWIGQIKAEGITTGTGGGAYSPTNTLSRAELAIFLLRTKMGNGYVPPACSTDFSDVACPSYWAAAWISQIKAKGVSIGCGPYEFCPDDPVDRAQAAVLFTRTFNIALDTRSCTTPVVYDVVPTHPARIPIVSLTFNPPTAIVGTPATGTLTLGVAPTTAVSIPLHIDNAAAATIPATVLVNAGQTVGTFSVTPAAVSVRTPTNITATFLGYTKSTALDICTPAPTISTQPTSRTINVGQSTTLSVTAGGTGPFNYQWYQVNTPPASPTAVGTNSPSFMATPAMNASYFVSIANSCSSIASATAMVSVCTPPAIATQPASDTIVSGHVATLSVIASGSGPFSYQWYDGASGTTTTPVGTNSSSFTTPALTATRSYWVRVTSSCNGTVSVSSNTAVLSVVNQITRRQTVANAAQSQTSVAATWPSTTQQGSLLVAVISASNNAYPVATFTAPGGWQLATWYEWNNIKTAVYYYPNNPGNRSVETFTLNSYRDATLQLAEYVGIASSSPFDRAASNGANAPTSGIVSTGNTAGTSQSKELVITALTTYAHTSYSAQTNGFTELDDRNVGNQLTTAMYERIVTTPGAWGHSATVGGNAQWIGVVATFRSVDTSAMNLGPQDSLYAAVPTSTAVDVTGTR